MNVLIGIFFEDLYVDMSYMKTIFGNGSRENSEHPAYQKTRSVRNGAFSSTPLCVIS